MSIQGQILEVTVVSCSKLKDTEWISRQDPYVCLEYATNKFRTRTCTDGGRNPVFQEKMNISLIEGLREISVAVWNSNTLSHDDFIGSGRVLLNKALTQGYDDSSWPIQTRSGRYAGDVKLILHFSGAGKSEKPGKSYDVAHNMGYPSPVHQPHYPAQPYGSPYMPPKSIDTPHYPPIDGYPSARPYPPSTYPPAAYPPSTTYPPNPIYPPSTAYPPSAYTQSAYPPQPYPPQPYQPSYPPAPYPGYYPPRPY